MPPLNLPLKAFVNVNAIYPSQCYVSMSLPFDKPKTRKKDLGPY
jgi:hypothetical protein